MKGLRIFVEGGGATRAHGQASLRAGLDALLGPQKEAARHKRLLWQLGFYGTRTEAFRAFRDTSDDIPGQLRVLLVDAEAPVTDGSPSGRIKHLRIQDRWDFEHVDPDCVHLMTQCMEAWIAADPIALEKFYGQGFRASTLPKRQVLDDEPKGTLLDALDAATKDTKKGTYTVLGKVAHASELLRLLSPSVVSSRCKSFLAFTQWLDSAIAAS